MAHGYLREYDEAPDRSSDRSREWSDRNRGLMFDQDRNRDEDRGFSNRTGEPRTTSFRDENWRWRSSQDDRWRGRGTDSESRSGELRGGSSRSERQSAIGGNNDWERSPRNFSSSQDDHYLSWRDRQIASLDQDYADYCREREQQFHSDFDNWRRNRQQADKQDGVIGEEGELVLTHERALAGEGNTPSPTSAATLGTNNSENTGPGRG